MSALLALVAAPALAQGGPAVADAVEADADFEVPMLTTPARGFNGKRRPLPDLRRTIRGSPDQVPLNGAGKLSFPINASALPLGGWKPPSNITITGRFWIDGEGRGLSCENVGISSGWAYMGDSFDGFDSAKFREALCDQFKANARFKLADWYGGEVRRGYVRLKIEIELEYALKTPLRLVSSEKGQAMQLVVAQTNRGRGKEPGKLCRFAHRIERSQKERLCDLIFASSAVQSDYTRKLFASGKKKQLGIYVPVQDGPAKAVKASVKLDKSRGPLRPGYAAQDNEGRTFLSKDDFDLKLEFQWYDNPMWTQFSSAWEGSVGVQFEINPNGRVKRCVPTRSSGLDLVDNRTCAAAVKRARFTFKGKPPSKPVYYRTTVTWRDSY